jgi:hypothetical protein
MAGMVSSEGTAWSPHVTLDVVSSYQRAFRDIEEVFYEWRKTCTPKSLEQLGIKTGWNRIDGEVAEQLLLRNLKNRKTVFGTVQGYAIDVKGYRWKKTGQPILIGKSGRLLDGAHRLWSVYLTGVPIDIFVIIDIDDEEEPNMFAYIDNVLRRNAADALETAGRNGVSPSVAKVITSFAKADDEHFLTTDGIRGHFYMAPVDVLAYDTEHPELNTVVHVMKRNYKAAQKLLYPEVANYLAWRIVEAHGYNVFHEFMRALLSDNLTALPSNHPIRALHAIVELHRQGLDAAKNTQRGRAARQNILRKEKILACSVVCFNMTIQKQTALRGLELPPQGFPHVVSADETEVEAADETL